MTLALSGFLGRVGDILMCASALSKMDPLLPGSFNGSHFGAESGWVSDPTQTCWPGGKAPAEGQWQAFCSGESAHGLFPTTLPGSLPQEDMLRPESHSANLALCLLASRELIDLPHVGPLQAVLEAWCSACPKVRSRWVTVLGNLVKSWVSQGRHLGWSNDIFRGSEDSNEEALAH